MSEVIEKIKREAKAEQTFYSAYEEGFYLMPDPRRYGFPREMD